tara:strand:+ start:1638 stop:1811 length:174 start_codon:yes stop_codon:yes gene_type:complete
MLYNRKPKNAGDILKNVIKWLKLNLEHKPTETDLLTDNKNLLKAIEEWGGNINDKSN